MIGFFLHHLTQFCLLLIIFATTTLIFLKLENTTYRVVLMTGISLLYFIFGILHHKQEMNLSVNTVLEYLTLAILLLWVMITLSFS